MSTGIFPCYISPMPKKGPVKYSDLISIRLEPELREVLERWAEEDDRSVGSLIRIILREAVRETKKEKKK